jgi:hypothetical protein
MATPLDPVFLLLPILEAAAAQVISQFCSRDHIIWHQKCGVAASAAVHWHQWHPLAAATAVRTEGSVGRLVAAGVA